MKCILLVPDDDVLESSVLVCKDASLAVQSEKLSTDIHYILKRFRADGVLPVAHNPAESKNLDDYPSDFTSGMNNLTARRAVYDDKNINVFDGLKSDLADAVSALSPAGAPAEPQGEGVAPAEPQGEGVAPAAAGAEDGTQE